MNISPIGMAIANNWWVALLRGILAVLFGVLAFVMPGLTLLTLVYLFAFWALVDGIFALVSGIKTRGWALIIIGIVGILAGILTIFYPGITAITLLYFIAAWSIVHGVFEIVAAIQLRKLITDEWFWILGGIISILFGIALMWNPFAGALAVVWIIGIYALIFGILLIILAFRLRKFRSSAEEA